jgi:hypothetical protein
MGLDLVGQECVALQAGNFEAYAAGDRRVTGDARAGERCFSGRHAPETSQVGYQNPVLTGDSFANSLPLLAREVIAAR